MVLKLNLSFMTSNDEIDFEIRNKVKNEKAHVNRRRNVHVVVILSYSCERERSNSREHPNKKTEPILRGKLSLLLGTSNGTEAGANKRSTEIAGMLSKDTEVKRKPYFEEVHDLPFSITKKSRKGDVKLNQQQGLIRRDFTVIYTRLNAKKMSSKL